MDWPISCVCMVQLLVDQCIPFAFEERTSGMVVSFVLQFLRECLCTTINILQVEVFLETTPD